MITEKIINRIYSIHKRPSIKKGSPEIQKLIDVLKDNHSFRAEGDDLYIDTIDKNSPFHKILISRIHGIEYFEKSVAIILPSCILFFNREDDGVAIHIRPPKLTLWDKLISMIKGY